MNIYILFPSQALLILDAEGNFDGGRILSIHRDTFTVDLRNKIYTFRMGIWPVGNRMQENDVLSRVKPGICLLDKWE